MLFHGPCLPWDWDGSTRRLIFLQLSWVTLLVLKIACIVESPTFCFFPKQNGSLFTIRVYTGWGVGVIDHGMDELGPPELANNLKRRINFHASESLERIIVYSVTTISHEANWVSSTTIQIEDSPIIMTKLLCFWNDPKTFFLDGAR